jgi:hypothetical protein
METVIFKTYTTSNFFSSKTKSIHIYEGAVEIDEIISILFFSSFKTNRFFLKDISSVSVNYSDNIYFRLYMVFNFIMSLILLLIGIITLSPDIVYSALGTTVIFLIQLFQYFSRYEKDLAKITIYLLSNKIEYNLTLTSDDAKIIQNVLIPLRLSDEIV